MAHRRERKQAGPEHGRRTPNQSVDSAAPPYQMVGASRSVGPAFVSPPPAAVYGGRRNIREDGGIVDRTNHGPRGEDVHGRDSGEQGHIDQEDSYYSVPTSDPGHAHFDAAHTPVCACGPRCQCKPACKFQIHSCPCVPCVPRPTFIGEENVQPPHNFEASRSDNTQQSFTDHTRQTTPYASDSFRDGPLRQENQRTRTPRANDIITGAVNVEPLLLKRPRAPTVNSDLAYVPTAPKKTPSRKQKDPTPLGFYGHHGSHSGQRYPKFNLGASSSQSNTLSPPVFTTVSGIPEQVQASISQTLPPFSSSQMAYSTEAAETITSTIRQPSSSLMMFDSDEVEPGSRSPSPLSRPRQRRYQCNKTHAAITGEDITNYSDSEEYPPTPASDAIEFPESSPGVVTYPAIPRSTSAGLFIAGSYTSAVTQSFPSALTGNPREPESNPDQTPGQDWNSHGHNVRTAATDSMPARHSSPASSGRGFPPPLPPPLPLPEFIAPRPATKQRYVSAGGTARLEDRPEITDFVLPPSVTPGISMPRELLLQRLDGVAELTTPTRSMVVGTPMPIRSSEEAIMGSSTRSSYEDGPNQQSTKRDRKESNSSQRLARFKRVFSFGKDGKDDPSS